MITFEIQDMTCGHCERTLRQALLAVDAKATLQFDLPRHRLHIDAGTADAAQLMDAIKDAGFTPVPA